MLIKNLVDDDLLFFEINTSIPIPQDALTSLSQISKQEKAGFYVFHGEQQETKTKFVAFAFLTPPKKSGDNYKLEIRCEPGKLSKSQKGTTNVEPLIKFLSALNQQVALECRLHFKFKNKKVKTIISLPLKLTEVEDSPFQEIQGLHLVKRNKDSIAYEVIMDLVTESILLETVFFNKVGIFNQSLIDDALALGEVYSKAVVIREGK